MGHDLHFKYYVDIKRDSVSQCRSFCQETIECEFFTYSVKNKYCWLKTSDNGERTTNGHISGKKFCNEPGLHFSRSKTVVFVR